MTRSALMIIQLDNEFSENNGSSLLQLNLDTDQLKPYLSILVVAPIVIEARILKLRFL